MRTLVVLALVLAPAFAAPAIARDRILLVGNSFTSGLRPQLRDLLRSSGRDVVVGARAVDGWTLANHAASSATLSRIRQADWNAVVLQEQSRGIFDERYPAARALDADISGRTVFFMTWRDRGAPIEDYDTLLGVPGGDVGYVPIAYELGAEIAPIGWAFREILLADPAADLWSSDGHHANERGRYLAALVLFTAICKESPVGLWAPSTLDPAVVIEDQLLVESLVLGDMTEWNIDAAPILAAP